MVNRNTPLAAILTLGLGSTVLATGGIFNSWNSAYPDSLSGDQASCALCHGSMGSGDQWNAYGWAIKEARDAGSSTSEAIMLAETLDSDGDPTGATNLEEILADAQPGWSPGAVNRIYDEDGSFEDGQEPPSGISGDLDPAAACDADVDGDGVVAVSDLLAVLGAWGPCGGCPADIDGNGSVDVADLLAVLGGWGTCP